MTKLVKFILNSLTAFLKSILNFLFPFSDLLLTEEKMPENPEEGELAVLAAAEKDTSMADNPEIGWLTLVVEAFIIFLIVVATSQMEPEGLALTRFLYISPSFIFIVSPFVLMFSKSKKDRALFDLTCMFGFAYLFFCMMLLSLDMPTDAQTSILDFVKYMFWSFLIVVLGHKIFFIMGVKQKTSPKKPKPKSKQKIKKKKKTNKFVNTGAFTTILIVVTRVVALSLSDNQFAWFFGVAYAAFLFLSSTTILKFQIVCREHELNLIAKKEEQTQTD